MNKKVVKITEAAGRPSLDQRFKAVISDSDVLSWILRGNVDELKGRSIDEIKSCLEIGADGRTVIGRDRIYESEDEGRVELDTAFDVNIPDSDGPISVIVGIEGQSDPNPRYSLGKRAEYYLARMVSSQKNREFTGADYGSIRKTYSIRCILDPSKRDTNSVVRYRMGPEIEFTERDVEPIVLNTFNAIFVYIGEYEDGLPEGLGFLSAMFSDMDNTERRELVSKRFNIELNDDILESVKGMSIDQDRYNYGHRVGLAEGLAEGRAEGLAEGIARGLAEGKAETIEMMSTFVMSEAVHMGTSFDEALDIISIPESYREEVKSRIREKSS